MKRYLYLWHRWLGIGLCLFMAMWFFSGMVMLYVGYPKLTPREHLAHLPALPVADCCAAPLQAGVPWHDGLTLSTIGGRAVYLLPRAGQAPTVLDARTGQPVEPVNAAQALAAAEQFAPGAPAELQARIDEDAWTHSRGLDAHRPLYRIALHDAQRQLIYVSSQTGAVVRDASGTERLWNWVGTRLHWLYPLRGNALQPIWSNTVIWLSLIATLMALLGMVLGGLRWRRRPYRNGSHSPYRGWARWHHLTGLVAGGLLVCWIFSGLMSMNPWGLFSRSAALDTTAFAGQPTAPPADSGALLQRLQADGWRPVELQWRQVAGHYWVTARSANGEQRVLDGHSGQPVAQLPVELLHGAIAAMAPHSQVQFDWLTDYDFYYYPRTEHSMLGHLPKPLPMLRARFDDGRWVEVDPATGELLSQSTPARRVSRVLFALLHSWDWLPLLERRPLWDIWMVGFSLGGLLISISGVVLGWRRLRLRSKRRQALASSVRLMR